MGWWDDGMMGWWDDGDGDGDGDALNEDTMGVGEDYEIDIIETWLCEVTWDYEWNNEWCFVMY